MKQMRKAQPLWDRLRLKTPFVERGLFPVVGGAHAEVILNVSAEIAGGWEVEHVGNLHKCQAFIAKMAWDVERGVAVDPEVGWVSAHFFAYLREIFRRYT